MVLDTGVVALIEADIEAAGDEGAAGDDDGTVSANGGLLKDGGHAVGPLCDVGPSAGAVLPLGLFPLLCGYDRRRDEEERDQKLRDMPCSHRENCLRRTRVLRRRYLAVHL